jgi:dTDP-4-amino-4,6-dideoxygalactose transaminase
MIPFNKPYITGKEVHHIYGAVATGHISGNGQYTQKCQQYFQERWDFKKTLLTSSGTDALELAALLLNIQPGDEVILPSYTFVSTALAFVRQGAVLRFIDSRPDHPGVDESQIEPLINSKTKAIVPVHYAGIACDMDKIKDIANRYNIYVVEDAAHAIDSFYISPFTTLPKMERERKILGAIGHLGCFSFHETKNIQCGEGGLLAINDGRFIQRAEILWEKGTNRAEFFRGEVNKYGWMDIGSSFLPGEITAAFLWAQLEELDKIQNRRKELWYNYHNNLGDWAEKNKVQLPLIPVYATVNGHMYYMVCPTPNFRHDFIAHLKEKGIHSVFHYLSLHKSPYYKDKYKGPELPQSDRYSDCLVRLPLFYDLDEQEYIIKTIINFKPS